MADYTIIADVGHTLLRLLRDQMTPEPITQPELIGLANPADKGDLMLTLFLYNITSNGDNRHNQMLVRGPGTLQFPPLPINLHYLFTAHSSAELQSRYIDEHRILGRALQVIYDNAILNGSSLQGSLADSGEELRLVMNHLPLESMINLFPNEPYKISFSLEVGPVFIDSTRIKTTKRVLERDFRIQG